MFGIFSKTTDSAFVEASGLAGLDFIILDQEHGPAGTETLHHHVRSARLTGMKSIIRVAHNQSYLISSALDTGADGVQIPNITSFDEAVEAVRAARFHPAGMRGVCRFVRAAEYGMKNRDEYFHEANSKLVILQIESTQGIEAVDKILEIRDFDVLFVGPYDLSQSIGLPGKVDHPDVMKLISEIVVKIKDSGKIAGTFADTLEGLELMKSLGFEYLAYSVDINLYAEKISSIYKQFRSI